MDKKNVRKYFNGINETDYRNIFRNHEILGDISINGFPNKNIDIIPKKIFVNAITKVPKKLEQLFKIVKKYYADFIDFSEYENLNFEEAKSKLNKDNVVPVLAYYLVNGESEVKSEVEKFIADGLYENMINESSKEQNLCAITEKEGKSDREIIMELDSKNIELNASNLELKNKNGMLQKENTEHKATVKQLKQQKKELSAEIFKLEKIVEEFKTLYNEEQEKNAGLIKQLEESKKQLEKMANDKNNEIKKHKIGILQDRDINEDRIDMYIACNKYANELIDRFEKFEKIYILERSVAERVRRILKKKEYESNKKVLEFIKDDALIKEIIEGKRI